MDGVETLADGRGVLKARVRAAPSRRRGEHAPLIVLVAKTLDVAPPRVTLTRRANSSRIKRIEIEGDGARSRRALKQLSAE